MSHRKLGLRVGASSTCLSLNPMAAHAAEGKWTEGFGQEDLEYFIDCRGWLFHISCPIKDGSADAISGVSLKHIARCREVKNFVISVGGHEYQGPFAADSRVSTNNFVKLLKDLRRSGNAHSGNAHVPHEQRCRVVPIYGAKFKCNVD